MNASQRRSVLIVYKSNRRRAASRWAIAINRPDLKVAQQSEKQFKSNEPRVSYSMPVIFIGPTKRGEEIKAVMPVAFSEYGATVRMKDARAVVTCAWPDGELHERDAKDTAREIAQQIEALTGDKSGYTLADAMPRPPSVGRDRRASSRRSWLDKSIAATTKYTGLDLGADLKDEKHIRDRYVELLYLYAAHRFAAECLDTFMATPPRNE